MEKTNFTFVGVLKGLFLPLVMLLTFNITNAQTEQISCNLGLIQVSVAAAPTDGLCTVEIEPDMVSEGDPEGSFVQVFNGPLLIAEGATAIINNSDNFFGETLTVRVFAGADPAGSNYCWGQIIIEDKAAPIVDCSDISIECTDAIPAAGTGVTASDNCSGATVELTDEVTTDNICANNIATVVRTYVAIDAQGNVSDECVQTITINRVTDVVFPADINWECNIYDDHNNVIGATALTPFNSTTGSGVPSVAEGQFCKFIVNHSDNVLEICGDDPNDNLFKIIRTWSVVDWCSGEVITEDANGDDNVQIIKVEDTTPPTISYDADVTVSANVPGVHPQPCRSQDFLPLPTLTDNCTEISFRIFTSLGEATLVNGLPRIPSPGLTMGLHDITIIAEDACGNTSELPVTIEVVDDITPTPVCDEITQVAIGANGTATVYAHTFDDGSNDNCGINRFEVRRMTDACNRPGNTTFDNDGHPGDSNTDTDNGEFVTFCCADIQFDAEGNPVPVMVALRVFDHFGNFNDCMVEVLVEDKLAPFKVEDVDNMSIACDDYFNNISPSLDVASANGETNPQILIDRFGDVSYDDNCEAIVNTSFTYNVNSCGVGTITRNWTVADASGNIGPACSQTISVFHVNDWQISFPADIDLVCLPGQDETLDVDFGEPQVFDDDCELIAISADDVLYDIVPDACYKIIRTYTAINWCQYDGDNLNDDQLRGTRTFEDGGNDSSTLYSDTADANDDGIVVFIQQIKVQDNAAPVITEQDDLEFCIDGLTDGDNDCDRDITLPEATWTDCSEDVTVTYTVAGLGVGRNYSNVAPGTFTVLVTAVDNCGNQSSMEYDFTVRDCKAPTPYCNGGLIVELMPQDTDGDGTPDEGMIGIWAIDFNAGSFDNCTDQEDLNFFIADVTFNPGFAATTESFLATFNEALNNLATDPNGDTVPGIIYNCDDVNVERFRQVAIFVVDEAGNVDACVSNLTLESATNIANCGGPDEDPTIAGAIATESDVVMSDVSVELNNDMAATTSNQDGEYVLSADAGSDVTVSATHDVYDQSVTTIDLVNIRKHILNVDLLSSPYKMIAADINNNGSITGADLVQGKRFILGLDNEYSSNTAWVFVDASYTFASDWTLADGYPSVANFNNIAEDQAADFVAIRVGDVNGSYGFDGDAEIRNSSNLIINANDAKLTAGQEVTIEFTSADYSALGYQFTLDFARLEIVSVNGNSEDFGIFENAITTSNHIEKAGDKLFSVTFKATEDVTVSEALSLSDNITKTEAYDADGNSMNVVLEFNNSDAADFALYQNTPNPVSDVTEVRFDLPTDATAVLTVNDMTGKVIRVLDIEAVKGSNRVTLSDLPAGVLTYTLATDNFTATKSMVVVK